MPLLIYEAIGSEGERLAMDAGQKTGIAVGWDEEFSSATFDSEEHDSEENLRAALEGAFAALDAGWASQLREVE